MAGRRSSFAHHADPGPAAWREYTGDPRPFYRRGRRSGLRSRRVPAPPDDALLGPVVRVQAMGTISTPTRDVRGGPLHRPDDRGDDAGPRTDQPRVRERCARPAPGELRRPRARKRRGSRSTSDGHDQLRRAIPRQWIRPSACTSTTSTPDADGRLASRRRDPGRRPVPSSSPASHHFIDCLRGAAEPVLTPEHAATCSTSRSRRTRRSPTARRTPPTTTF